jgi:hypothetical protein
VARAADAVVAAATTMVAVTAARVMAATSSARAEAVAAALATTATTIDTHVVCPVSCMLDADGRNVLAGSGFSK